MTPLTPANCDLRDFPFLQVDVQRLLTSETWVLGTADEKAASITLWLACWHQVPAASVPNNDRMLAHLSQAGAKWGKVKAHALRGWVDGGDGRLYHPVVAEKALAAWIEKLNSAISGAIGNAKRWQTDVDTSSQEAALCKAIDLLKSIAPASPCLKKKVVAIRNKSSPPDRPPTPKSSPTDRNREGEGEREGEEEKTFPSGYVVGAADAAPAQPPVDADPQPKPARRKASDKPKAERLPADEPKAERLPADWRLPKAWGEWVLAEFPHWTPDAVRSEADKFRDHWKTKTGKEGRKADWAAAWRNWCRSDIAQRSHQPMRAMRPAQMTADQRSAWEQSENERAKVLLFGESAFPTAFGAAVLEVQHETE